MARAILLVGAIVWGAAALSALVLAVVGVEALTLLLPPLAIDTDALRGAIVAVAVALALGAAAHLAVLGGLRARSPRARSAGILLAGVLGMAFVALSAAGMASAIATPASAPMLVGAGLGAAVVAAGYVLVAVALVNEQRAGSAS